MSGKTNQVKCLICGAVFDATARCCPVCGVGAEHFVPVTDSAAPRPAGKKEKYVIIGGGVAALEAAKAIRTRNPQGTVLMISAEETLPYQRPMLTKTLAVGISPAEIALEDEDWYAYHKIYVMRGIKAVEIDLNNKEVVYAEANGDTERTNYDKLILAMGARCFVPPFTGADLPHVVSIRTIGDVKKLRDLMKPNGNVVIIGGGVLGLEAAWDCAKAGQHVTVLEGAGRLLAGKVSDPVSAALISMAAAHGVRILSGVQVGEIKSDHVVLADGRQLPADAVVVSCGVRANVALATECGLEVGRAIKVNDKMETSVPDVWAAGDVAELNGVNYQMWQEAAGQGEVAGANATGDTMSYQSKPVPLSMRAFGTELFAMGYVGGDPDQTVESKDEAKGILKRYHFVDDKLAGAELLGDASDAAQVMKDIENGKGKSEIQG